MSVTPEPFIVRHFLADSAILKIHRFSLFSSFFWRKIKMAKNEKSVLRGMQWAPKAPMTPG